MEKDNLIYKQAHPTDQRSSLICLTEKGNEKAIWVQQSLNAIDEAEFASIPSNEREQFLATLGKIIANQKKW